MYATMYTGCSVGDLFSVIKIRMLRRRHRDVQEMFALELKGGAEANRGRELLDVWANGVNSDSPINPRLYFRVISGRSLITEILNGGTSKLARPNGAKSNSDIGESLQSARNISLFA